MLLTVVSALAAGIGSALLPIINAEGYAAAAAATVSGTFLLACSVAALAVGQTLGKVILFESAHRGADRFTRRHQRRPSSRRTRRWADRCRRWLASPRTGPVVVMAAASVGVPPLAVTSIAAGAAHQPRHVFIPLCLIGRIIRFVAIVAPLTQILR